MKASVFSAALGELESRYITEAAAYRRFRVRWGVLAACACLVLACLLPGRQSAAPAPFVLTAYALEEGQLSESLLTEGGAAVTPFESADGLRGFVFSYKAGPGQGGTITLPGSGGEVKEVLRLPTSADRHYLFCPAPESTPAPYALSLEGPDGETLDILIEASAEGYTARLAAFPASDFGRTEYNEAIYAIEPFSLSFALPEGWSAAENQEPTGMDLLPLFSKYELRSADGECVGMLGYTTYEPYEGAEDDPRAIYSQIALGNHYQFDVRESYRPVTESENGVTALCDVYYSALTGEGEEKYNRGIVAYDRELLVYVAFELDAEKVTEAECEAIAASLRFIP